MTVQSPIVTVLFVDICDSTRLYHQLGDGMAHSLAMNCLKVVAHATIRNRGKVVKNIGDGAMVTFSTVEQAYRAAAHIQHTMRSAPLKVKVGFHMGPVIIADGDVFGNTVNLAERVMGRAGPGEILMTRACIDTLSPVERATVRLLDAPLIKGQPETEIYRVISEAAGETTVMPEVDAHKSSQPEQALLLSYGGDVIRMSAKDAPVAIGRESRCRIVIANDCTSRHHATVDVQGNGFVLTDRSTNGTYVVDAKGNEQFLRRESAVLAGSGSISIGILPGKNPNGRIRFRVEDHSTAAESPMQPAGAPLDSAASAIYTARVGAAHAARQFQSWSAESRV